RLLCRHVFSRYGGDPGDQLYLQSLLGLPTWLTLTQSSSEIFASVGRYVITQSLFRRGVALNVFGRWSATARQLKASPGVLGEPLAGIKHLLPRAKCRSRSGRSRDTVGTSFVGLV